MSAAVYICICVCELKIAKKEIIYYSLHTIYNYTNYTKEEKNAEQNLQHLINE